LFTLVGIAGEDDVETPDLATPQQQSSGPERPKGGNGSLNGGQLHAPYPADGQSTAKVRSVPREPTLGPEASAEPHDRLLGEPHGFASGDDVALWAHTSLAEKNKLTAADAQSVEQAFQAMMTAVALPAERHTSGQTERPSKPHRSKPAKLKKRRSQPKGIDKSHCS
jgi:hypothetical protein